MFSLLDHRERRLAVAAAVVVLTAGCGSTASRPASSSSPSIASSGKATPMATAPPSQGFACGSVNGGSASAPGSVTGVQVMSPAGIETFDRFVIQFSDAIPHYTVQPQASPTFTQSPSGRPVTLAGDHGVLVKLEPVANWTAYSGPTELKPNQHVIKEAKLIENFEGVQQWALGVSGDPCVQVTTEANPTRLVIDVTYRS